MPKPARMSTAERQRFLTGLHLAVLVTIAEDGTPVPTPIWYLYRDGAFYFRTAADAIKTENVRRDPRVSICVQEERPPYKACIAYGTAELQDAGEELSRAMPRHYLGAIGAIGYQRTAQHNIESGPEITIVVRPDRYVTWDYTRDMPVYGRAWLLLKRILPPWL